MNTQDDGEALKRRDFVRWFTVAAVAGVALIVTSTINIQQSNQLGTIVEELVDVRLQVTAVQAAVRVDQQYLAVIEVLAAKASDSLTPQQIPEIANLVAGLAILYRDDGLTSSLVLAVMERESNFRPDAISRSGAVGIMQIIPETAELHLTALGEFWSVELMQQPQMNISVGVMELMRLHRIYMVEGLEAKDEWHITLTAYFWGPTNARRLISAKGEKVKVPSLEYAMGVREFQNIIRSQGVF